MCFKIIFWMMVKGCLIRAHDEIFPEAVMKTAYRPIPNPDADLYLPVVTSRIVFKRCTENDCDSPLGSTLDAAGDDNITMIIEDVDGLFGNTKLATRLGQGCARMKFWSILVIWSEFQPSYYQAVANAHGVARQIATYMIQANRNIHLIGIGVGAHVAGYIGKICATLGSKIKRISGIDPARILFEYDNGPPIIRLDKEDARFVDVYHSDYKGKMRVGFILGIGDVDFYEYGGSTCEDAVFAEGDSLNLWASPFSTLGQMISNCKHNLAVLNFMQTMALNCTIYAVRNSKDVCTIGNCLPLGFMSNAFLTSATAGDKGNYVYNCTNCMWGVPTTTNKAFETVFDEFQKTEHPLLDDPGWLEWLKYDIFTGVPLDFSAVIGLWESVLASND